MFRAVFTNLATRPLTRSIDARGMATLKDIQTKLSSVDMVSAAKYAKDLVKGPAVQAALVELRPPTPAELPKAIRDGVRLFTKGNWQNITVREAWLNALVTTEVICWFFVGEVIGKGTLIGYQV